MRLKRRSVFCLEPPGHSMTRKSYIDSFLLGCIPVFFEGDDVIRTPKAERMWPLHFQPWRAERGALFLPAEPFLNGSLDLVRHLTDLYRGQARAPRQRTVQRATRPPRTAGGLNLTALLGWPSAGVRALQRTIGARAQSLAYARGGYADGDATDVTLRALRRLATDRAYCRATMPMSWRCD